MHGGRVSALACLRGSAALLGQRFVLTTSLGLAVVLGLVASCCGIGALIAPLFLCELLALQLANARALSVGERPSGRKAPVASFVRHRGWISACVVLLGAVALTASVGWLVALGLGTEIIDDATAWPGPAWLLVPASALFALVFVLPFMYAPLFLIERPVSLLDALLESARTVWLAGPLAQLGLSCAANSVQVSPLLLGSALAHLSTGPEQGSLWALLGLPAMALTIPLGQGMITWSFAQRTVPLAQPRSRARLPSLVRPAIALWSCLLVAPLLAFGALGASLVRPSQLSSGTLPADYEPMGVLATGEAREEIVVPATALVVRADRKHVSVEASDGGGAGRLPLASRAPIDRVRIGRSRDRYAIAIDQGQLHSITYVDRSGVRLDDDLRARLGDHIGRLDLALMVLALLLTAAAQLPLLAGAGRALGKYAPSDTSTAALVRGARSALVVGLLLTPLALWSIWSGLRALVPLP